MTNQGKALSRTFPLVQCFLFAPRHLSYSVFSSVFNKEEIAMITLYLLEKKIKKCLEIQIRNEHRLDQEHTLNFEWGNALQLDQGYLKAMKFHMKKNSDLLKHEIIFCRIEYGIALQLRGGSTFTLSHFCEPYGAASVAPM